MKWLPPILMVVAAVAQESPVPSTESAVTGTIDLGYRWRTDIGGNVDSYRSVVDLGAGPKLFGANFSVIGPAKRVFDRLDFRAYNWGDDPYSRMHVTAKKTQVYEFSADYRNIAYFNALPSFANPMLGRGVLLNERSFDIRRRLASMQLDLRPGSTIIPYVAYERSSGFGRGLTTFVSDANEYPVPNRIRDSNDTYRGGVRFEFRRFHATGEIGKTSLKDDQQVFSPATVNSGNRETPFLGQNLFLSSLQQSYGVRGSGVFTKLLFTSNAFAWLDVYGNFLYSRPETHTNYQQLNAGNFANASTATFVTMQQFALATQARMPHLAGSAGAEIRPMQRTRVIVSWLTDRLENTGSSVFSSLLKNTYNQSDVDLIVDAGNRWTLRGGYRYVWADAQNIITPAVGLAGAEAGEIRRHVGKGGFTYRVAGRMSVSADGEAAASGGVYFRTSLNDYQRLRTRARYQATNTLNLSLDVTVLNNQNPSALSNYDFRSRMFSAALAWTPVAAKRMQVNGSYSRSTIRSDIFYIAPQFFEREHSRYRDDCHTVEGRIDLVGPKHAGAPTELSLGGVLFRASGSRPTQHYQPVATFTAPITKAVTWISEWRYHGFGQAAYGFEGFRTHLITTGLRVSR